MSAVLDKGTLTVAAIGSVSANAISMAAGNIAIHGMVSDGGSGTVSLIANAGTINQTGTLIAGTLSGSAIGGASLLGSTPSINQIGTLGSFSVTAGDFALNDAGNPGGLLITGPVNANNVAITDTGSAAITITGSIVTPGTLLLASGSGGIALGGSASIGGATATVDLTTTGGGIIEPAGASITAAELQSSGNVVGTAKLDGSNAIAKLGSFLVDTGDLSLIDGTGLAIVGDVFANNIAIVSAGQIDVTSGVFAPGTIALTSGSGGVNVGSGGSLFGAALIDIDGGSGGISVTGTGNIGSSGPGVVDLHTTGGINEAATATLNANVLQSTLGISGDVVLSNAAISNIADFAVTGGSFTLGNSTDLSVFGKLTATAGAKIVDSAALVGGRHDRGTGHFADRNENRSPGRGERQRRGQSGRDDRHDQRDRHAGRWHADRRLGRIGKPDRGNADDESGRFGRCVHRVIHERRFRSG